MRTTATQSDMLTEIQVAEMLNLTVRTVQQWRFFRKNLPYRKFGRSVRYARADVERFMQKTMVEAAA